MSMLITQTLEKWALEEKGRSRKISSKVRKVEFADKPRYEKAEIK